MYVNMLNAIYKTDSVMCIEGSNDTYARYDLMIEGSRPCWWSDLMGQSINSIQHGRPLLKIATMSTFAYMQMSYPIWYGTKMAACYYL